MDLLHTCISIEPKTMPMSKLSMGAAVLNNILYIFGGIRTDTGLKTVPYTYGYDPMVGSQGQWTQFENKQQETSRFTQRTARERQVYSPEQGSSVL